MSLKSPLPLQLRGWSAVIWFKRPMSCLFQAYIWSGLDFLEDGVLSFAFWFCFGIAFSCIATSHSLPSSSAHCQHENGGGLSQETEEQGMCSLSHERWSVSGSSVLHVLKDENGFNVAGGSSSYSRAVWVITQGGCKCAHTQYPLDPCIPFPGPTALQSGTGIWKCHGRNHQILSCQKVMSTWNEDFQ